MPKEKITSIGGQALMEGIMMVGPHKRVAAFCDKKGQITTEEIEFSPLSKRYPILKTPFIRGFFAMIDSFRCGYAALSLSADHFLEDEEEEPSKLDKWLDEKLGEKGSNAIMSVAGVLGLLLAVLLFFFLPTFLVNLLYGVVGNLFAGWRSLLEGCLRLVIFLLYLAGVGQMKDMKRLFMYHGAEHKTIFCYEKDMELTVENVRKQTRFHPRCGTSFMVLILIISIVVGFFIPFTNPFLRTFAKLLTIPVVMGIGYELLKFSSRHDNFLTRLISAPGLWVQRLTTKEPTDDSMIEAAIEAMKAVIPENGEDLIA
ncbi:DUF1385 domain-containing protein [Scatolibacter rhodanostii]|uniref:DUF1385 domain-containing protein n=1 Tax=Scatolibacter rhodanostii TaxID=2014781 RepID=UPI000C06ACC6|nr:DUF1385 domain-containing protein [Scatolibacter rhodanostii]